MAINNLVEVFCDFDGTITKRDTVDHLLESLADNTASPSWEEIEALWVSGEIGSRECMAQQVALLRGGWTAVEKELATLEIDPTFKSFAKFCKDRKIKLVVVSDGLDRVIAHILKREGIEVDGIFANHLEEDATGNLKLSFPFAPRGQYLAKNCGSGMCKCQIINEAPLSPMRIVIGDSRSDFCWSGEADLVFAKKKLLEYCLDNNLNHKPFTSFTEIEAEFERIVSEPVVPKPVVPVSQMSPAAQQVAPVLL